MASAGRLYGGDEGLRALWGEMVPVPEENLRVLKGGETDVEGAFRVEYTPGHASHHVCYFHEPSRWAFVGDVGGARIPPHAFTVAPTPPPDIDVAAWKQSIAVVRRGSPSRSASPTSARPGPSSWTGRSKPSTSRWSSRARPMGRPASSRPWSERVRAGCGEDADAMLAATPLDQLHMGLARWRTKFG